MTDQELAEMRGLIESGVSNRKVALQFDISEAMVRKLTKRHGWQKPGTSTRPSKLQAAVTTPDVPPGTKPKRNDARQRNRDRSRRESVKALAAQAALETAANELGHLPRLEGYDTEAEAEDLVNTAMVQMQSAVRNNHRKMLRQLLANLTEAREQTAALMKLRPVLVDVLQDNMGNAALTVDAVQQLLTATDMPTVAKTLGVLTDASLKVITAERTAYDLDDSDEAADESHTEAIMRLAEEMEAHVPDHMQPLPELPGQDEATA